LRARIARAVVRGWGRVEVLATVGPARAWSAANASLAACCLGLGLLSVLPLWCASALLALVAAGLLLWVAAACFAVCRLPALLLLALLGLLVLVGHAAAPWPPTWPAGATPPPG
jgi:hypothetical protein